MKFTAEQTKTFLRLQRKHNVSVAFIMRNMPAILKFIQYAMTSHAILMIQPIRRRNRIFLRHNCLRKFLYDPAQFKKRRKVKRIRSQWSKHLVTHLRSYKMKEFFEDEISESKLPEEVVSKQLKEQLELLKSGKRTVPLLVDAANSVEQRENVREAALGTQAREAVSDIEDVDDTIEDATQDIDIDDITQDAIATEASSRRQTPVMEVIDLVDDASKSSCTSETFHDAGKTAKPLPNGSDRPNGNFLDMLISKVKSTTDDHGGESNPPAEVPVEHPETAERENSNSSSDFFGFDDSERIPGTFPGMLSTPLVHNRDFNSAFVSETLNAYMRDNSLGSSTVVDFPKRRLEDGLVYANSPPPKLDMPALPDGLQGLRTVAERRIFLQKSKNLKYCIINNVGTIFRELQKRLKGHRINKNAIEVLQTSSPIPLTRQSWRAASWLLTDEGNYYFQTMTVDGKNVRLFGCRGNSQRKFKRPHTNRSSPLSSVCTEDCIDRITFRALRPIRTLERRSKLSDAAKKITYKACPLSQKIYQRAKDDEPFYGSLEIVRMPQIELEVFPQLQKPLNDIAKRYLQLILPHEKISREWANFSVSTLLDGQKMGLSSPDSPQSFTFTIPFANDRNHVLVRRVYNRCEAFEDDDKSMLTFRKELDQNRVDGQPPDIVAEECADVLTDMLNSVAISCSENSFIKDDPDNIYQYGKREDEMIMEKSTKKPTEAHPQTGHHNKKQSRLLMELRRLNATIIDAAATKTEEDGITCDKESCKLGCVCASLNEGSTVRQHCGKQRCILECSCKCPSIMRLETDGRTITTEDAFMLRRQATAKLARMEKEFTSTIVLTGSETLLINESQYDKKRRCTKIPKRYGDFVDPDDSDYNDSKSVKRTDTPSSINLPLEPIMVKDKVYQRLKHCAVKVKKLKDVNDLAPWCMVHMVYKCHCKGRAVVGSPIVVEKQEEYSGGITIDEGLATKNRALYSFDKEESKANDETSCSSYESETDEASFSDTASRSSSVRQRARHRAKRHENRGRVADVDYISAYMNAKANHCRRVVPIPKNTYQRRNKKRVARVQLYIAEHETDETKLSLNEHVLRSVYYHRNHQIPEKRSNSLCEKSNETVVPEMPPPSKPNTSLTEKRKIVDEIVICEDDVITRKKRRMTIADLEEGSSLLRVNRYKDANKLENSLLANRSSPSVSAVSAKYVPPPQEQITVPKISQIFSLNVNAIEMGTDTAAAVAAEIPQQSTEAANSAAGVSSDAFKNVFQVVIKNMNNLVSKKMQDIDMALRRDSKAIPTPNEEILCILRWNNFLEAFQEKFVYLWEVRTGTSTFMAATIKNIMPLVINALSVVNIRALPKDGLPLLGRMLVDEVKNTVTDGLAVVMQGQKMFWYVKGFLRPDITRVCPKPTPETHPLLTRKINVLCKLLINQQINEHKKRQESAQQAASQIPQASQTPSPSSSSRRSILLPPSEISPVQTIPKPPQVTPKLKVLPIQRNISDNATLILEQMVSQAYGLVRTNIAFRKLRQAEIPEICQPANVSSDHHWLVLDLSNDFSHIFIPELKDLLTLDRIQKVITYAVNKTRVVKLQFSHKSMFNAYVTPMSRRKLYFGPFRNSCHKPKLVLLQSVDGQMMLREVYEARHNVTGKADKTTAFWLIQKDGKLFLDIEGKNSEVAQGQGDIHEIIDDDVSIVTPPSTEPQQSIAPKEQELVTQLMKPTLPEDDDDDCFIVENEEPTPAALPAEKTSAERMNYTISYTGESSSLVVIQNECESIPAAIDDTTRSKFTILTPQSHLETQKQPMKLLNNFVSTQEPQLEPLAADANVRCGKQSNFSLTADGAIVPTSNISKVVPTTSSTLLFALPLATQLSDMNTGLLIKPAVSESIPLNETSEIEQSAEKKEEISSETDPSVVKLPGASMQWNKNVTITKIVVDSEQQPLPAQQSANTIRNAPSMGKTTVQNPTPHTVHFNLVQKPATPRQPISTPMLQKPTVARQLRPQPPKTTVAGSKPNPSLLIPQQIRPVQGAVSAFNSKITARVFNGQQALNAPRPTGAPQGGLTVRTPTAINSFIRIQQAQSQHSVRHPLINMPGGVSLLRPITPQVQFRVQKQFGSPTKLSSAPQTPTIRSLVRPISKSAVSALLKGSNSPKQSQFKRFMVTTPPFKDESNTTATAAATTATCESDPLQISEDSDMIINNLPQPKLPNDVKTVRIASNDTQAKLCVGQVLQPTSTPAEGTVGGVKRNSNGTIVNRRQSVKPPSTITVASKTNPATLVTSVSDSAMASQISQVKGIPVEFPRLKTFAIVNTVNNNTTVITPPTAELADESKEKEPPTPAAAASATPESPSVLKKKVIASCLIKCSSGPPVNTTISAATNSKSLIKVTTPNSAAVHAKCATKPSPVANTNTEYGYFHANIDGLPKFVVKRVNEDFLIKVPNFNGILKLTGLKTVFNYLNQYTAQKCGRTQEEIANLKWTFKAQDRSKLNNINKSNAALVKPGTAGPIIQRQIFKKTAPTARVAFRVPPKINTSPSKPPNNVKPTVATPSVKKIDAKDSIVLLEDE